MLLIFRFISKLNLENAVLGTVQNMASSIINFFSMAHAHANKILMQARRVFFNATSLFAMDQGTIQQSFDTIQSRFALTPVSMLFQMYKCI